jgi:hypothetical protein
MSETMSEPISETEKPRILISQNRGETWRPMPQTWRQSGTILEANAAIVRQDAGGGHEVWYRLDVDEQPQAVNDVPVEANAVSVFIESLAPDERDGIDIILENAQIAPEDPRFAGIAASLHFTAILARRIDQLKQLLHAGRQPQ